MRSVLSRNCKILLQDISKELNIVSKTKIGQYHEIKHPFLHNNDIKQHYKTTLLQ